MFNIQQQPVWLLLAIASGGCAAFNGVFAKLTTTDLTTTWSSALSTFLSLSPDNNIINYLLRGFFFGLNLLFNIAMWSLFTAALTRASSTTRVSIINVSSNFAVTAFLGLIIFGENLPALWWVGAALLAAGNVVIGSRDEEKDKPKADGGQLRGDGAPEEVSLMRGSNGQAEDDADMIDLDRGIVQDEDGARIGESTRASEPDQPVK